MDVYRISKQAFSVLDGAGGLLYSGRWHMAGHRIIYAAGSRSLAALEYLVHLNQGGIMANDFVISTIHIPSAVAYKTLDIKALPAGWAEVEYMGTTQKIGTEFLKQQQAVALKVPSAIVPDECNYIINPAHQQMAECTIKRIEEFKFDSRLTKLFGK